MNCLYLQVKFVIHKPSNAHLDLTVLAKADYFIGNCISTFTAFVKRDRDTHKLPSKFWDFQPRPTDKDELKQKWDTYRTLVTETHINCRPSSGTFHHVPQTKMNCSRSGTLIGHWWLCYLCPISVPLVLQFIFVCGTWWKVPELGLQFMWVSVTNVL